MKFVYVFGLSGSKRQMNSFAWNLDPICKFEA